MPRQALFRICTGLSPASAYRDLFGAQEQQSSFAHTILTNRFTHTATETVASVTNASCASPPRKFDLHDVSIPLSRVGPCGMHSQGSEPSSRPESLESSDTTLARAQSGTPNLCSMASSSPAPAIGVKRKASGQLPRQMEQPLTLSLEELYSGCVKRMLLTRKVFDTSSSTCRPAQEVLEVTVSPGWREGTRVTFHGKGDHRPGYSSADVVFVVREELHPRFERRGNDLYTRVNLPLVTALTGGTVQLTMLDRRLISLPLSDIITPHCERIVQGEGMPVARCPGKKGDLHINFDISFPQILSPLQRCLVKSAFLEHDSIPLAGRNHTGCGSKSELPASETSDLDEAAVSAAVAAARAMMISTFQDAVSNRFSLMA